MGGLSREPTSRVVRVRRSTAAEIGAVRALTADAFASAPHSAPPVDGSGEPGEAALVEWLLTESAAIPELSLVAESDGALVGHVVCSRGYVDAEPALGLGPISVHPDRQRAGVGSALMQATIGAAQALGEPVVALLGDPAYYSRFGFRPAAELGITAPEPQWGDYFQALDLGTGPLPAGRFRYAEPFDRI